MNKVNALSVSIGVLGGLDTYLTATIILLPVRVTFIAWACFFILGGGTDGFVRTVASMTVGIVIASLSLLAITVSAWTPLVAGISVGMGSAAMVQSSRVELLSAIPAIVRASLRRSRLRGSRGTRLPWHPPRTPRLSRSVPWCSGPALVTRRRFSATF